MFSLSNIDKPSGFIRPNQTFRRFSCIFSQVFLYFLIFSLKSMFDVISLERLFNVMQGKGLEVSIGFIKKIMYILWFYLK